MYAVRVARADRAPASPRQVTAAVKVSSDSSERKLNLHTRVIDSAVHRRNEKGSSW
jgi:hypothetical protein